MKNDPVSVLRPQELVMLANFCKVALSIINGRLLTISGMLISAAGFGYVLWQPDWIRAFAACAFSVLVFWPLHRYEVNSKQQGDSNEGS